MSVTSVLEVLDRAHNGPVCAVKDWDSKVIPSAIAKQLKAHNLLRTCNPQEPVNTDDALADRFFKAGFDLALELGMLCIDTERRILMSAQELWDILHKIPPELVLGEGRDRVIMYPRKPEDPRKPLFKSPLGITVSEDLWVVVMQGIVENREIDVLQGGSLETVFGHEVRSQTPYETLVGYLNARLTNEALWRAGRPGMPVTGVISSVTAFGQLGGFGVPGGLSSKKDIVIVLGPSELKTSYHCLHKVVHAVNCGAPVYSSGLPMIGGYAGGPEGVVLVAIAYSLLHYFVHQATYGGCSPYDLRYMGNTGRHAQWVLSTFLQALSRNSPVLKNTSLNVTAGPGTKMLLYESMVTAMTLSVSGVSIGLGPRSAAGKYQNHLSPLECKWSAEVIKACAGMTRAEANEIAKKVIPKYEERLPNPPKGYPFQECYDIKTLTPKEEWHAIYREVKAEAIELGIPVHRF
ncbi:MAG: monomethylamine:corrinoid methyltransferase [Deltaproteobacteria bacterium]|nr:monomethylamine:corrinoid methyltransferase [Deltaproteobacteria bacterium]